MSTVQSHTVAFYCYHFIPIFISGIIILPLFVIFITEMWFSLMYKSETWWISWILLAILDLTNMVPMVISKTPNSNLLSYQVPYKIYYFVDMYGGLCD